MFALIWFFLAVLASPFKSKSRLETENAALRHQLIVLRRKVRGRPRLTNNDGWFLVQLYRWFPSILQVLTVIRSGTLVRWLGRAFAATGVVAQFYLGATCAGQSRTTLLRVKLSTIPSSDRERPSSPPR